MYIVDFAQRLWKKQNIGIIIYLILNTLLIVSLFGNILSGLIIYILSISLALSPFGEWVLRLQQGCKAPVRKEHVERLQPLFDEVYERAKKLDPSLPSDVKFFICKDKEPNAFATGRKTICLTRGLLEYSDDEIKSVLAHEFGHLSHKDTDLILVIAVGNMIVTLVYVFFRIMFWIFGVMVTIANRSLGSLLMTFLIDVIVVGGMWLWTKLGTALVMHSSRKNEYEADKFSYDCGYGEDLIHVIDSFNEIEIENKKSLWATLAASHPDPDERIGHLQKLDDIA